VSLLSVSNVGISFGATELFKNITFTVADGERWGIIGRNGAGKTSIFKVITGDLQPAAGSVVGMRILVGSPMPREKQARTTKTVANFRRA
jgi:ATPase subunit of ABC transporter with duplicated ATPase domains